MQLIILRKIVLFLLLFSLTRFEACDAKKSEPVVSARKDKNEQLLKSLDVPVNPNLPEIEDPPRLRTSQNIARRAVVLYAVVLVGYKLDKDATGWLKREGLWDYASKKEKDLLESRNRSEQDLRDATWRIEALLTLLWALEKIDKLELPRDQADGDIIEHILPKQGESTAKFINQATLRSKTELLDATDLIYRIHWAVVEAQEKKSPIPGNFDSDVVYERHYALNWLAYNAEDWDNIHTDT